MLGEGPGIRVVAFEYLLVEIKHPLKNAHGVLLGMTAVFDWEDFELFPVLGDCPPGNFDIPFSELIGDGVIA
jgi:hypothetical protein